MKHLPSSTVRITDRTVGQLNTETFAHVEKLGYSKRTLQNYKSVWEQFLVFSQNQGLEHCSLDAVQDFLKNQGISIETPNRSVPKSKMNIRTAMRILTEFHLHGCFQRRMLLTPKFMLSKHMEEILVSYLNFCNDSLHIGSRTMRIRRRNITMFLHFLDTHGIISVGDIQPEVLSKFMVSQCYLMPRTLCGVASNLRGFLRYLCMQGYVSYDLEGHVPKVRFHEDDRIPSVWLKKDVEKLLASVDRSSPIGKRDYAILLLAARLGMRVGDIRDLKLENIHWEKSRIEIIQAKTGIPLHLPLTEEIGSAIIDYLRNGRPLSSYREVFIRYNAPFIPFGRDNNLHSIISIYRRRANIKLPAQCRRGMNALRHTLASRLLEAGAPLQDVSNVMGHLSPETTRIYTKIDIKALRSVALDLEEAHHA